MGSRRGTWCVWAGDPWDHRVQEAKHVGHVGRGEDACLPVCLTCSSAPASLRGAILICAALHAWQCVLGALLHGRALTLVDGCSRSRPGRGFFGWSPAKRCLNQHTMRQ